MVIAILIVLGLCFGSFVNALVWRLHEQGRRKSSKGKTKTPSSLSILHGRSMCPNCGHELAAKDLLPVLSWLSLGGKCRYCHKPISAQYPAVELLTVALFISSYVYWPMAFDNRGTTLFIFWLVFMLAFVALAVYDLRWFLLPDKIISPMIGLALLQAVILIALGPAGKETVALLVSTLIGGGIFYLIFQVSRGNWIGGGDVKLGFLLGLVLADGGLMILTIFLASVLGSMVSIPLMIGGKAGRTTKIPFGPFLIAAAIISYLFGGAVLSWYSSLLG